MIVAVTLAVLSAFLAGLSVTMQKAGIMTAKAFSARDLLSSKRWLLSVCLAGTSFVLYTAALGMERLSVIQPLLAASVIFAAVASHHINMEKLTIKGALAVVLVFAGVLLLSVG